MDFLKKQLDSIRQQVGALSASQKMLTATLLAIMVMTLFVWTRYAGEAEMEPLLNQAIAGEDLARMTALLAAQNVQYKVSGDRLLVPVDRKTESLAVLGYNQALPRDTKPGLDEELLKGISPWAPDSERQVLYNQAKQLKLASIIRDFPSVAEAMVLIDPTETRSIGSPRQASATVSITLRQGAASTRQLVNAAADLIAGAQSNLSRKRISVIIDGIPCRVQDREDSSVASGGDEIIYMVQQHEKYQASKIQEQLSYIRGVLVVTTVKLNTADSKAHIEKVDPTGIVHKPIETNTRTEETSASTPGGQEPGAVPNAAVSMSAGGGSGGGTSTVEETKEKFELIASRSVEETRKPAGDAAVVSAAVSIPRSYLVSVYKSANPNGDPTDAALAPIAAAEITKARNIAKSCTGLKDDADVTVETYADAPMTLMATVPMQAAASPLTTGLVSHAKELALGVLAVMSLLMVSMMVRKGNGTPVVAAAEAPRGPQKFDSVEDTVGVAAGGETALDGMELDEDAVKTQQMLDQVQNLVKENPEGAAALVKRRLNR